ncbi:hypothetical protein [Streptomyces sp. TR02-1]|uniref:hypothetical protein n=1 Tax=Streptomyces sp. TR02-1 TaxID=3385977 RepID=UPI00399F6EF9
MAAPAYALTERLTGATRSTTRATFPTLYAARDALVNELTRHRDVAAEANCTSGHAPCCYCPFFDDLIRKVRLWARPGSVTVTNTVLTIEIAPEEPSGQQESSSPAVTTIEARHPDLKAVAREHRLSPVMMAALGNAVPSEGVTAWPNTLDALAARGLSEGTQLTSSGQDIGFHVRIIVEMKRSKAADAERKRQDRAYSKQFAFSETCRAAFHAVSDYQQNADDTETESGRRFTDEEIWCQIGDALGAYGDHSEYEENDGRVYSADELRKMWEDIDTAHA